MKKIHACTGFVPMTSAIPVQHSYQLSYLANWELATFGIYNTPVGGEDGKWIYEIHTFLLRKKHLRHMKDHGSNELNFRSWEKQAWKI